MTDSTLNALIKARARIATGWCQASSSLDERGRHVAANDPRAVCWCITGAVSAVTDSCDEEYRAALTELSVTGGDEIEGGVLYRWNDAHDRTQDDVLKLFDDTIARLQQ